MPQTDTTITQTVQSVEQLGDLVRDCADRHAALIDYGIGHAGLGYPPSRDGVQLRLEGGVIEHYQRDFAVRVAAGCTVRALHEKLREQGQFLALDADPDMTIGEVIAHNVYGPLRQAYGGPRDQLLGLHYTDARGQDVHVGGRTVKNVAGYDVTRLMVGSLGELGVINEATLRTYAVPEHVTVVDLHVEQPDELDRLMTTWLLADAAPTWMSLTNQVGEARRSCDNWRLSVGYYGRAATCLAQFRSLQTLLEQAHDIHFVGTGDTTLDADLRERTARRSWRAQASAVVKIIVPPAATGALCQALCRAAPAHPHLIVDALPTHGCVFVGGMMGVDDAVSLDERLNRIIHAFDGQRVWYARPDNTSRIVPFAPAQRDWPLLRRLKRAMDPDNLFNPGRFLSSEACAS